MAPTPGMTAGAIAELLRSRVSEEVSPAFAMQLESYLKLLQRWNERTNLTAIRDPKSIVLRHFAESLQCSRLLPSEIDSLLDYGSGAGFPGVICALARPELTVTLAESQGKKAAFLRELCRTLGLSTAVHAGRVEQLPARRQFGAVTLRAVDNMAAACRRAQDRVQGDGWLVLLTTSSAFDQFKPALEDVAWRSPVRLQGSDRRMLVLGKVQPL